MPQNLGMAQGRISINTSGVKQAADDVKSQSEKMNKSLSGIGVGIGLAAVTGIGSMALELAKAAANAEVTRAAFNNLTADAGQNAEDFLGKLRNVSRGMIADNDLVLASNRAMLLGVSQSGEELAALLEVASARATAMGITSTQAFNDIVTGIGRMSPLILDNLGIVVGGEKAFDNYAKSIGRTADSLTDTEKKQFLINKTIKDSQQIVADAAKSFGSAAEDFQRFNAELENSKMQLGAFLLAAGATDSLATFSKSIADSKEQLKEFGIFLDVTGQKYKRFYADASTIPGAGAVVAYF